MGKNKLARFAKMRDYDHVVEPKTKDVLTQDHQLKGKWGTEFFKDNQPLVLELACGKGEYALGLGQRQPERNFLGVDIKGARMFKGATEAIEKGLTNIGFLRTRIELIASFFGPNEVEEIWITFPDPQLKKTRKRLTYPTYLMRYRQFLKPDGTINLKTDSQWLYHYTKAVIELNKLELLADTDDLYNSDLNSEILSIRTFYEQNWLQKGKTITYLKFRLPQTGDLLAPDFDEEWARETFGG